MGRTFIINEQQYRDIFLNEEQHYPSFLDNIKKDLFAKVNWLVDNMVKHRETQYNDKIKLNDNQYFTELNLNVDLAYNSNIFDEELYNVKATSTGKLSKGKLMGNSLTLRIPVSNEYKVFSPYLYKIVSHEATHLYDIWNDAKNNGVGIVDNLKINDSNTAMRIGKITNIPIMKELGNLAYMSIDTEKKAFTSQLMQELEMLGCGKTDYHEKIRKTDAYVNVINAKNRLYKEIGNISDDYLRIVNDNFIDFYPNSSVPKLNKGAFNSEKYKTMLYKWVDRLTKDILKRIGGVLMLYLERQKKEYLENNSLIRHGKYNG